ncbi:MAG: hypothetical protein UH851_04840, partial [Clostridia bacterium]|nr:hypothetical protein [Clostridia bacterium]
IKYRQPVGVAYMPQQASHLIYINCSSRTSEVRLSGGCPEELLWYVSFIGEACLTVFFDVYQES